MRYISLAINWNDSYLRHDGNGRASFNGHGYAKQTIWLREVVDDKTVRLRNLDTGAYLAPGPGPEEDCILTTKDVPLTAWTEVPSDDGNYFSYLSQDGRFLTADRWVGYGSNDGQSGCFANTSSRTTSRPSDDDGYPVTELLSYVPLTELLPWPANGTASVEEYIKRHSTGIEGVIYEHMSRARQEELARELQLTIEPEPALGAKVFKLIKDARTPNEIDVSGNLEH